MRIYLAGPMTGIPHFNYPAFNAAAARLRAQGHLVFNPAEHDIEMFGKDISNPSGSAEQATADHGFDRRAALKADLSWICDNAEAIALLPGWEKSSGATAEHALAKALNLRVINLDQPRADNGAGIVTRHSNIAVPA
jgi:hypothetical protein